MIKQEIDQIKAFISNSSNTTYINEMPQVEDLDLGRQTETQRETIYYNIVSWKENLEINYKNV